MGRTFYSSIITFLILFLAWEGTLFAQNGPVPSDRYFHGYDYLHQANPEGALEFFQTELNLSVKLGSVRWIDSICYYAMMGESYYMSGKFQEALDCFNNAIDLHIQYSAWLSRVEYPIGVRPNVRPTIPWGPGNRKSPLGILPAGASMTVGDILTESRLKQGGLITPVHRIRIAPLEILKCLALSLRRRLDILGPMVEFDPMTPKILKVFAVRSIPPNHWSITWIDVLFGLALEGAGKKTEAANCFKDCLLMAGQYDHSLTGVALYELGRLAIDSDKAKEAIEYFFESSISAFHYQDYILVQDALCMYSSLKKTLDPKTPDLALQSAFNWVKTNKTLRSLQIALGEEIMENMILANNLKTASSGLLFLNRMMESRAIRNSRLADRWNYLQALLAYAQGHLDEGDLAMQKMIEGIRYRSPWLFQLAILDKLTRSGAISTSGNFTVRNATDLYEKLLRDPNNLDWGTMPMDTFAVQVTPMAGAYEQLFLLLVERDLKDKAFEMAEKIRRQRFYQEQFMGGRLSSLRYMAGASEKVLPDEIRLVRQNFFLENPSLQEKARELTDLESKLHKIPIIPKTDDERKLQKTLLQQYAEAAMVQEAQLRFLAAGRINVPQLFPPVLPVKTVQAKLGKDWCILSFLEARGEIFGFMITPEVYDFWRIGPSPKVASAVAVFLKTLGCTDGKKEFPAEDLSKDEWKKTGKELLESLLGDPSSNAPRFSTVFKKLIIVPDSTLWYLPFEAISVAVNKTENVPLLLNSDLTIRYAPVVGLALPGKSGRDMFVDTTVVPGQLFPKTSEKIMTEELSRLATVIQNVEVFQPESLDVSSAILAPRLKRLIVFNEIMGAKANWIPFTADSHPGSNSVNAWGYLPWGAPRLMVFPGFRSMAENALKNGGNGNEFFIPILTLKSTGAETILISRWRVGGRSSYDLVNSFMKNQLTMPMEKAWKESVVAIQDTPLIAKEEPRLSKPSSKLGPLTVKHPFFWSSFMLIDAGEPLPEEGDGSTPPVNPNDTTSSDSNTKVPNKVEMSDPVKQQTIPTDKPVEGTAIPKEGTGSGQIDENQTSGGVVPVIKLKPDTKPDKAESKKDAPDTGEKTSDKTKDSKTKDNKTKDNKTVEKKSTTSGPRPVTDDSLKKEDDEADDFYKKD